MAQISINRKSEYSNKFRTIQLVLNGQIVEEIKDGETKIINLEAGNHVLKAKIDWCQSNEIELKVKEGESKKITLEGTSPFLAIYYISIGKNRYLKLKEV